MANITVTIVLSLKNTPLGWLTGWTYERLNVFHRFVGYLALGLTAVHGATYSAHFLHDGEAAFLRAPKEIYGIVAGFCFLTLVSAGVFLRRRRYELFYVIHVVFFILAMVFVALHQPETGKSIIYITVGGAGVWVLDRLVRAGRVLVYSVNNTASLYPLPGGGTRIVLRKAPVGARAGEHCFVWIPRIRMLETHPFTIVSTEPLEFVVAAQDGFTRELHDYAERHPGASLRASVEGSYGTRADVARYDAVVMIAGGSGASYTFAHVLEMCRRDEIASCPKIMFTWIVRDYGAFP